MRGKARRKRERGVGGWVGEVMLLSCLFLIGLSRDGDLNNSFVEEEGGGFLCAHVRWSVCGECAD